MRQAIAFGFLAITQLFSTSASALPVQSSLNVTDFAYQLTDLNTQDGVAPAVTFLPTSQGNLFVNAGSGYDQAQWSSDSTGSSNLFAGSPNSLQLWGGLISANKARNLQQVSSALDTRMMNLLGTNDPQALQPGGCCVIGQVKTYMDLTLSAHTSMTITAQISGNADVFASEVGTPAYVQANPDQAMLLRARTYFSAYAVDDQGQNVGNVALGDWNWFANAEQTFTVDGAGSAAHAHSVVAGPILMTVTNDSDQDKVIHFGSIAVSESEFFASAVPEPQTWGLMALGLVCVAGTARRQRRA